MHHESHFDLKLEQYLLGELSPREKAAMEKELSNNAKLRQRLQQIKEENEQYYRKYPRLNFQTPSQPSTQNAWWKTLFSTKIGGGLLLAAACLLVILLLPKQQPPQNGTTTAGNEGKTVLAMNGTTSDNGVRSKGLQPSLFLSIMRDGKPHSVTEGAEVLGGDEVQIAYRASGARFGVIVSVDADKSVTLHFPDKAAAEQKLAIGARVSLGNAFKLDDNPGFEKFYFITADQPIPLKKVLGILGKGGTITEKNLAGANIISVILRKK